MGVQVPTFEEAYVGPLIVTHQAHCSRTKRPRQSSTFAAMRVTKRSTEKMALRQRDAASAKLLWTLFILPYMYFILFIGLISIHHFASLTTLNSAESLNGLEFTRISSGYVRVSAKKRNVFTFLHEIFFVRRE